MRVLLSILWNILIRSETSPLIDFIDISKSRWVHCNVTLRLEFGGRNSFKSVFLNRVEDRYSSSRQPYSNLESWIPCLFVLISRCVKVVFNEEMIYFVSLLNSILEKFTTCDKKGVFIHLRLQSAILLV